jgi:hypothetical protein
MNRLGLGLAVGAGYVLGRTKKMKLAFAIGTMAAGKRMHLSPRALADLASQQLQNNPQFKEIGGQLREDLRGVGKAASGALVERQIEGLADRLHGRTAEVRDQLAGVVPDVPGLDDKDASREADDEVGEYDEPDDEYEESSDEGDDEEAEEASSEEEPAEDEPWARRKAPAKKAPAKKAAQRKPSAKKVPAKKTAAKAAKKAPGKKTASAKTSARRATRTEGRR